MKANGDKDQLYNLFNGCKECQLIRWENNFYRGSTGDICVKAGNKKCVDSVFDELFGMPYSGVRVLVVMLTLIEKIKLTAQPKIK